MAAVAVGAGSFGLPVVVQAQVSVPEAQVSALEALAGKPPTYRRSQATGVCASGHFEGNAVSRGLSRASVFNGNKVPVIARLSVGGGNPKASDKARAVCALCAGAHGRPCYRKTRC